MEFLDVLRKGTFCMDLRGATKRAIVEEIVDRMVADGQITEREAAVTAIMQRENRMSTGMQCGVALPHAKTDTVDRLVVALALCRDGVDFDSLDRLPSRIFIVTLSPVTMVGPHTQYLAAISRVLGNASARERLLQARSAAEAIAVIAEHVQDRRTATPPQPPGGAP